MNLDWASRWIASFSVSVEEAMKYYSEECDFRDFPLEHIIHNDKPMLSRAFIPFSNSDTENGRGIHHFEATEYFGDENSGIVLWRWTATHCASLFGLPNPDQREVSTIGMSYHQYRENKIVREFVHSDQIHVLKQLGYPVDIPHYWEDVSFQ